MNSIEWLKKQLEDYGSNSHLSLDWNTFDELCEQAKEMHKQEIIDAWEMGRFNIDDVGLGEEYYQETFGQGITLQNNSESKGITELSNESWEGCDSCTEQDEVMYKNGYVKGYNAAIAELPKEISDNSPKEENKTSFGEISDEEIEKAAAHHEPMVTRRAWVSACKWYREQLKQKQNG